MQVNGWTSKIQGDNYAGAVSNAKPTQSASTDVVETAATEVSISETARRSAMVAAMEKDGIASGDIKINTPDWDSFQLPTLKATPGAEAYRSEYIKSLAQNLNEVRQTVEAHYAPELSKMQGMSDQKASDYLFQTYRMPYMKDLFGQGTPIPEAPHGMSEDEARTAYEQLSGLRAGKGVTLRDPYALGEEGMKKLDTAEIRARAAAQKAQAAAQREVTSRQYDLSAARKELFLHNVARLNNSDGTGIMLGYMSTNSAT